MTRRSLLGLLPSLPTALFLLKKKDGAQQFNYTRTLRIPYHTAFKGTAAGKGEFYFVRERPAWRYYMPGDRIEVARTGEKFRVLSVDWHGFTAERNA